MKVFQFKICVDFYGPRPACFKPVFVAAPDCDIAVDALMRTNSDVYSIELISVNDVLIV